MEIQVFLQERGFPVPHVVFTKNSKPYIFEKYGNALWDKIKDLPHGYCHGDMYSGNIHKTPDDKLYILDFDTSCEGFPLYDLVLICNMTDYFDYDKEGYEKSGEIFARLLPKYQKHNSLNQKEIDAFYNLLGFIPLCFTGDDYRNQWY